jgi:hypothetical protein
MPNNEDRPIIHKKQGLRYNGFYLPWPFVGFCCAAIFNAGMSWKSFYDLEQVVTKRDNIPERVRVLEIKNDTLRRELNQLEWRETQWGNKFDALKNDKSNAQ